MISLSSTIRRVGIALALASALTGSTALMSAVGVTRSAQAAAQSCTPGYTPCISNKASDVDCYGGSGNGPRYTRPGVVYRVTGRDRYGLDANHNGQGCER